MIGLAIDVGTSVVKVAAFDEQGTLCATSKSDAPVLRPQPAFSEYDPLAIWRAVCAAVHEITADLSQRVDRIAVTGQGDGCWLIEPNGRSVGHAILWNDGRSHQVVEGWVADGRDAATYAINGSASFPGAQSAILRWLRDHEPDKLDRSGTVLFCTGWLTHRLTGVLGVDRSDASLPWLDIRTREYSTRIPEILDMDWAETLRPPLLGDATIAGELTRSAATDLDLEPGIPVVHAPFDCVAMAIGAGVVEPGDTLVILGTTLIVESVVATIDTSGKPRGMSLCTGLPDNWLRLFGTLSGTDSINWMSRMLGLDSAASYVARAADAPAGAHGVRVLPYFSPAGERAPFIDPTARATLLGVSLDHTRADLARAHLEGLTYAVRHCIDQTSPRPAELVVCGGGAASDFWCGLIASVTGTPTRSLPGVELGAMGADTVARAAIRGVTVGELVAKRRLSGLSFEPDRSEGALYEDAYAQFHMLREQAQLSWRTTSGGKASP